MQQEDFIDKAKRVHGDFYDYSLVDYKNSYTKVSIICPKHGRFEQSPAEHLRGKCIKCSQDSMKSTREQFINRSQQIHGQYDYSQVEYVNARTTVTIICPVHGEFKQKPYIHLSGSGCPKCYADTVINTTAKFINKARQIHGDAYGYTQSKYVDESTKIDITCPKHGTFRQAKQNHLRGAGCPECAKLSCLATDFITKAKIVHGDKYDYGQVQYLGSFNKIIINCPEHGAFEQMPSNHLSGNGCSKCANDSNRLTIKEFIERAASVHDNKYDYSSSTYICSHEKISIICPKHGPFEQKANNHLQGQGCPKCPGTCSRPQLDLEKYVEQTYGLEVITNYRSIAKDCEIDIYIPSLKLGIEYHGLYWHSYNQPETTKQKHRHQHKALVAREAGVKLLQFFDFELLNKKDIVYSIIDHNVGISHKVNARDLKLNITYNMDGFFDENHLQGSRPAKFYISLTDGADIIMAASFSRYRDNVYELIRMATKRGYCVRGGLSRIMYHFKSRMGCPLMTYADLRYSDARGYEAVGFRKIKLTSPGYFYYHESSKIVMSRQRCQKHKLHKLLDSFNPKLTEADNMFRNGFRRVWDAGHLKLIL